MPAVGFFIGLEPRFQVFDGARLFDSVEHAQRVFSDPDVRKRLATFGATKASSRSSLSRTGRLGMLLSQTVRGIDDLKGRRSACRAVRRCTSSPFRDSAPRRCRCRLGEVCLAQQPRDRRLHRRHVVLVAFKYYDVAKSATQIPSSFLIASGLG